MVPILEIQHISKKFVINHESQPYLNIRDSFSNFFKSKKIVEDFWALDDVTFNVMPGDTLGIIGKNGAGKSTLLKILSKITPPTSGKIIGRGRIASLLEVGTGFHSELSGRENIFMNGSILGMKRSEIIKNFDAIVDFAGIEKFIDNPLKHYSSGMQLRLAFAVAAFLENEILIIDEVLAVGDAEFQKKCLGKMSDVSKSGRTILFVSHQMGVLAKLCQKGIFLQNGKLNYFGDSSEAINLYLNQNDKTDSNVFLNKDSASKKHDVFIKSVKTCDVNGNSKEEFSFEENINLRIEFQKNSNVGIRIGIAMVDKYENRLFSDFNHLNEGNIVTVELPSKLFAPNNYSFIVALLTKDDNVFFVEENICSIRILDTGTDFAKYEGKDYGYIIANCKWSYDQKNL